MINMAGTVSSPIFVQDGQYISIVVGGSTAVTLGSVIEIGGTTTQSAITATQLSTKIMGVAVSGNRVSRTQTANSVAVGDYVTVVTRGVVNVTLKAGASMAPGDWVVPAADGYVDLHALTTATLSYAHVIGRCLVGTATSSLTQTVTISLRGF